ncbi:MAG: glutamate-5-semialdehyde dehydrogenase [Bacteroidota bacterium]
MEEKINRTFKLMIDELESKRQELLAENEMDVSNCDPSDVALYDRLHVNDQKIDGMIESLEKLIAKDYPVNKKLYAFTHENGLEIENRTAPFGTIMIIYESRPDVTVEATATALKSGNKILLKGGKEARRSNLVLHACWERALRQAGLSSERVRFLDFRRSELQAYLKNPDTTIDLIIPRGGEKLIEYVHSVAQCPVLVSGRGNNFLYVSKEADLPMAKKIIMQSKLSKISACNALDKVLVHQQVPDSFVTNLKDELQTQQVELVTERNGEVWKEEFLDLKILIDRVGDREEAIQKINTYSGGHSATIITNSREEADAFMQEVDCAAVYHNASTRFTDGFQFGLGAEMAISTDKLHHRGPLGVEHLVTNKWYVRGHGQTR